MNDSFSMQYQWLPFTANNAFKSQPRILTGAKGAYFTDESGRQILDGCSGLFCVPAGHGRVEIADAIAEQVRRLDFSPPFQFAHPLGFQLAEELVSLLPPQLNRIFFVNSGSESVETAMKMALAYYHARGETGRHRFIGRERAYHGVNFGGLSVGGMVKNRETFGPLLPAVSHLRQTWSPDRRFLPGQSREGAELADDLQRMIDLYGAKTIAAVVVEPIAGSTGILVPPQGYLPRLRKICDANDILLIFDEVITGFGRTGRAFASDSFNTIPDILTMAKALTNGTVPMGAVAAKQSLYETIVAAGNGGIEFFHGYTWSGNPVACAAALANLKVFRDEDLIQRAGSLSVPFQEMVFGLKDIGVVTDLRGYGLLAGIDLAVDQSPGKRGFAALNQLFEAGLVARVTMDTLILAPPFIASESQLSRMLDIVRDVLKKL